MTPASPHERETQLADDYLQSAILARNVAHKALERTQAELEAGTLRDPGKAAVNAATAGGIMLDKRLILEGRPTQIHAVEDPVEAGKRLLGKYGITIETTAEDITGPNALPLPSEGVAAKRAHAREANSASQPAD